MFEIFTAAARQALVTAQDEAIGLGYDCVAAEHILIGLAAEADGVAAEVLAARDITAVRVRDAVPGLLAAAGIANTGGAESVAALATIGIDVNAIRERADEAFGRGVFVFPRPAYTAAAKRAIERSVARAQELGHDYVGAEHMLLGLTGPDDEPGGRALRAIGSDAGDLRTALLAALGRPA